MMRRLFLLTVWALTALGTIAPASALSLAVKQALGPPGWVLPLQPDLQFDFARGAAWKGAGTGGGAVVPPSTLVTVSRASTCIVDDLAGNWREFAVNTLCRLDKGASVWEARTNSIRNNSMQGVIPADPNSRPTNWTSSGISGITIETIGTGVENGIDYIDLRFVGTPGASGTVRTFYDGLTQIAAAQNQIWAASSFMRLVGGNLTNAQVRVIIEERNSGGSLLVAGTTDVTPTVAALGTQRFSLTRTLANATTAFVDTAYTVAVTSGSAIDLTVRIGWPQLEQGTFVSPPIRTTGAAATRAADVVTATTPPQFGPQYTIFVGGTPAAPTSFATNQFFIELSDGTTNNRFAIRRAASTGTGDLTVFTGGAGTTLAVLPVWPQGSSRKSLASGRPAFQAAVLGSGALVEAAGVMPAVLPNKISIGANVSGIALINGYVEGVTVWPVKQVSSPAMADLAR